MELSKNTHNELTLDELIAKRDRMLGETSAESDFMADSLLDHIYENPLGKLLQIISTLPEVRLEKVDHARRMIAQSEDELDCRMDIALDRVLEELITEE